MLGELQEYSCPWNILVPGPIGAGSGSLHSADITQCELCLPSCVLGTGLGVYKYGEVETASHGDAFLHSPPVLGTGLGVCKYSEVETASHLQPGIESASHSAFFHLHMWSAPVMALVSTLTHI